MLRYIACYVYVMLYNTLCYVIRLENFWQNTKGQRIGEI